MVEFGLVPGVESLFSGGSKGVANVVVWDGEGPFADTQGIWIDGKYRLVINPPTGEKGKAAGKPALYDIFADPAHKTNLADEHPEIVQKMRTDLDAWRTSVRASYDGKDFAEPSPKNPKKRRNKDRA